MGALFGALTLFVGMASLALATTDINLTTAGADVTAGDARFIQGGTGAGTGNFDPFLSIGSNDDTEQGVNSCVDDPNGTGCNKLTFDTIYGGGRTHAVRISGIPTITIGGVVYREFSLDANDTGSDDWMSIDAIKLYADDQANLHAYNVAAGTFGNDTGTTAQEIYDLGDAVIRMRSQTLTPGSGVSDITMLVKDSVFPAGCQYGSTTCNLWLYFYTHMGGLGLSGGENYNVTGGFEEWRIRLLPVVNVTKTATPSFDRTYDWTVLKTVDPTSLNMFNGDSGNVTWSVTPTRGAAQDSNWKVTGSITVTNPTGSDPIPTSISAVVNSVTDVIDGSLNAVVTCPGVTFPKTLAGGASFTCTYTYTFGSAPAAGTHTNVATANINNGTGGTNNYTGSATFDFANATPTTTDATASLSDTNGHSFSNPIGAADSGVAITYQSTYTCGADAGSHSNTATLTETDSQTQHQSTATTTVNCYALSVTKDAHPALTRSYDWTILKTANPTSLDLFNGDSGQTTWTITVTRSAPSDSGWGVTGTITISNPAPMQATGVSVADVLTGSISGTVDCDPNTAGNQTTVNVPAKSGGVNGTATCSYSATLPDGTTRTNTATATLFSQNYSGTASVNFANATVSEVDESANVSDGSTTHGPISGNAQYTWNETFACGETRQESNTATVTVVDDANDTGETHSSTATVDITCYGLTVTKDATTTFTRDYNWQISKTRFIAPGEIDGDNDPSTLELQPNQTYSASYHVTVGLAAIPYVDSNWGVHGTITIQNPAPMIATGVSVSDLITESGQSDIAGTVDCDPNTLGNQTTVNIPAKSGGVNGQATCSYSADLPNADSRTNTATATLFSHDYTGQAAVTFGSPTSLVDECVNVTDNKDTADTSDDVVLGQVCVGDAPHTFTFTLEIGPFAVCGDYTFTNKATYLAVDDANDSGETNFATYTVNIHVPCPEGCTLTWGYWKTHNDSFWGGAPTDPTWDLLTYWSFNGTTWVQLGPGLAEQSPFFLSGQTYFQVMQTPPAGNAYYNLAHQYIGAQLNFLAGADPTAAQAAFDQATALFKQYTPAQIAALKGKAGNALRAQFISLAGTLAAYNQGDIGPGHCDEDPSSGSLVTLASFTAPSLLDVDRRHGFLMA